MTSSCSKRGNRGTRGFNALCSGSMARIRSTRAEHPGGFWSPDSILERHTGWGCTPRADTSLQQTALFLLPGEGTRSPAARPLQGSGAGLWAGPAHRAGGQEAACEALINFALGRAPRQVPGTPRPPLCPGEPGRPGGGWGARGAAPGAGLLALAAALGPRSVSRSPRCSGPAWSQRGGDSGGAGAPLLVPLRAERRKRRVSRGVRCAPEDGRVRGLSRPGGRGQAAVRGRGRRWGGDGCRQGPGVPGWR